jgi:hypothetical protein
MAKWHVFLLMSLARKLANHPELGKPVVGAPGVFVCVCIWKAEFQNGQNLFYRTTPDGIEVLAFRHTSTDNS